MKLRLFVGALVFLNFLGCASKPIKPPTTLTLAEFWKEQSGRETRTKKFSGKLSVTFKGPEENVSGSGRIVSLGPNQSRLELRDPLGRTQYVLVETTKGVWVFVPSLKKQYRDSQQGRAYFKRTLGIGLSSHELKRLWLGMAPLQAGTLLEGWHWDYDREAFAAKKKQKDQEVDLYIDGDTGALREARVKDKSGTYKIEYGEIEEVEGLHFAHTVKITVLNSKESFSLEWDEIEWQYKGTASELSKIEVPANTETVILH